MSLLKCRKCGEMFSDSYKSCPFCAEDEEYYNTLKQNCETMREKIIGVSEYCDIVIEKYKDLIKQR